MHSIFINITSRWTVTEMKESIFLDRPDGAFSALTDAVMEQYMVQTMNTVDRVESGYSLSMNGNDIYIINARCTVSIILDGKNIQLLSLSSTPLIIACTRLFGYTISTLVLQFSSSIPVYHIHADDFLKLVEYKGLWQQLANIMGFYLA